MKKIVAVLLCLIMTVSLLVGCGGKESNKNDDGRTTITIGIPQNMQIPDYDTNAFTVWLEETTGYNIEFHFFASNSGDYASQLSTMIAGGKEKLPDMLFNFSLGSEVYRQYGEYGYFLELSSYFNDPEKGKPFWDRVAELPEVMQTRIKDDLCETGKDVIYALPFLQNSCLDSLNSQVYINKVWLDKLGLDMPTDNESLYQVLKAFVNNDPNGNGKKDEIGIIGSTKSLGSDPIEFLMNLFVNVNDANWFNLDSNGQLMALNLHNKEITSTLSRYL